MYFICILICIRKHNIYEEDMLEVGQCYIFLLQKLFLYMVFCVIFTNFCFCINISFVNDVCNVKVKIHSHHCSHLVLSVHQFSQPKVASIAFF